MGCGFICNKKNLREIKSNGEFYKRVCTPIDKENLELNVILKITEQMKTCTCKIEKANFSGTGFFCMIDYPDINHKLPVLITSYSVLGEKDVNPGNSIKLIFFDKSYKIIKINKNRKIYLSNELKHNITIIEIINKDEINIDNMLKMDRGIYNENYLKLIYTNKTVYMIYFSQNSEVKYDINIITNIDSDINKLLHLCSNEGGSLGAPILNLENYDVIGINLGNNLGTLLKGPIKEFFLYEEVKNNHQINEITLTININKDDVGKTIFFLDNTEFRDYENNKFHYHDNLKELNAENTKLYIDEKECLYAKCFRPEKVGIYIIRLEFNIPLTDCSYMFYYCYSIINIDFSFFDSSKVTNMSYMFALCLNIITLDLSNLDTSNVTNMNNMFYSCQKLIELDLSSLKTQNVINMSRMFSDCTDLRYLNLKNFNTENVQTMSHMFFLCKNIIELDLTFFNTSNVIIMSNMFYFCNSLRVLDLRSFNTEKVFDMNKMFYLCRNLRQIHISSFDTRNVINMSYMFSDCKNLLTLDLSNFDTSKVIDMSHFLSGSDLTRIDLSNFNTINVSNMSFMFYFCKNVNYINVSSFNTKNVKNMSYMFSDCRYLIQIDLSSFDIKNVTDMSSMFAGCIKDIKVKVNENSIEKFKNQTDMNIFYK